MADDEAGGCLVAPVADDHCAAPLPVVGDDLPVIIPEHEGGVQVERPGLDRGWVIYYVVIISKQVTCMMQVRLMVEPFSMYLSLGPRTMVFGWMTPRYILCSMWGVVLTCKGNSTEQLLLQNWTVDKEQCSVVPKTFP